MVIDEIADDAITYTCSYFGEYHNVVRETFEQPSVIQKREQELENKKLEALKEGGVPALSKKIFEDEFLTPDFKLAFENSLNLSARDYGRYEWAKNIALSTTDTYPFRQIIEEKLAKANKERKRQRQAEEEKKKQVHGANTTRAAAMESLEEEKKAAGRSRNPPA